MLDEKNLSLVPSVFTDLRVMPETQYTFDCVVCRGQVAASLAWVLSTDAPAEPFRREELRELGRRYGGVFQPAQCGRCQALYLVREEFTETSYGAFRVKIDAVWKVSEPAV